MPFKTILTVVGVGESDQFLNTAIDFCRESNCHLSVLVVALAAPPPIGSYAAVVSDAWMEERERDTKVLANRLEKVRALLSLNDDISSGADSLYSESAWAENEIGTRTRYADIVLLGSGVFIGSDLKRRIVGGALFNARRPILVVPEGSSPTFRPRRILLAWDSSSDSAGAAREATELLAAADSVHITMVDPQANQDANGEEPGADMAAYLVRHGAKITVDRLASGGSPVAEVLKKQVADMSADMIVMGAYGHSRLRERIFGGVTQSMLDNPPVPIFMAR